MIVKKKVINYEETAIDFVGATLLSEEEAERVDWAFKEYPMEWWLRTPSTCVNCFTYCDRDGDTRTAGDPSDSVKAVRPALIFKPNSQIKKGDEFEVSGYRFVVIGNYLPGGKKSDLMLAFMSNMDIGYYKFDKSYICDKYERSEIKKYVDSWFSKTFALFDSLKANIQMEALKGIAYRAFNMYTSMDYIYIEDSFNSWDDYLMEEYGATEKDFRDLGFELPNLNFNKELKEC